MTDRLDPRCDPHLAALERRLELASLPTAVPDLRRRVLSAVDAVLDETAPTISRGWPGESLASSQGGLAFVMSVVAATIALVAFSGPAVTTSSVPLSLDDRARIAGVSDEALARLVADGRRADSALRPLPADGVPARPVTLRVLDAQRILQETL